MTTIGTPLRRDVRSAGPARRNDRIFTVATTLAGATVLAVLAGVVVSTAVFAWPALQDQGWHFLTSATWSAPSGSFGALALIYGTVVTSIIAVVLAVPVALGISLFLDQACPRWLRNPVVAIIDLLAAIPSVVFGLVGALTFSGVFQSVFRALTGPRANGSSMATAGIILAFMITPIIASLSREVIATVPVHRREAAAALGATRWEVITTVILPAGAGGIVGAVMLGLGRALGETIAVALVIGGAVQITGDVTQPGSTMASIIANRFNGEGIGLERNALMGLGVVLFVVTVVVNLAARVIVDRAQRRGLEVR